MKFLIYIYEDYQGCLKTSFPRRIEQKFFHYYNTFHCLFSFWFVSSWLNEIFSLRTLNAFLNRLLNATSNIDPETRIFYSKANLLLLLFESLFLIPFSVSSDAETFPNPDKHSANFTIWGTHASLTYGLIAFKTRTFKQPNWQQSQKDLFNKIFFLEKFIFLIFPSYSIRFLTRITSIIMSSIHAATYHGDYMFQPYHIINSGTFRTKNIRRFITNKCCTDAKIPPINNIITCQMRMVCAVCRMAYVVYDGLWGINRIRWIFIKWLRNSSIYNICLVVLNEDSSKKAFQPPSMWMILCCVFHFFCLEHFPCLWPFKVSV